MALLSAIGTVAAAAAAGCCTAAGCCRSCRHMRPCSRLSALLRPCLQMMTAKMGERDSREEILKAFRCGAHVPAGDGDAPDLLPQPQSVEIKRDERGFGKVG